MARRQLPPSAASTMACTAAYPAPPVLVGSPHAGLPLPPAPAVAPMLELPARSSAPPARHCPSSWPLGGGPSAAKLAKVCPVVPWFTFRQGPRTGACGWVWHMKARSPHAAAELPAT
eukprot:365032-Chlamydomonas_euryale.AAC.4